MSPARSASNSPCPQAPPVMWSQRALPNTDIIIKGEGLPLDSSRTSSTISVNGRLGGGAMGPVGAGGNPTRSFLQTKVGAKMLKQGRDQSQVLSQEVSGEPPRDKQNSSLKEEGGAEKQQEEEPLPIGGPGDSSSCNPQQRDSRSDSGFLDTFVEKKDQELFQRCREHLDSINQSTQQQQFINDEMRSQAELDQMAHGLLKAKAERLAKQTALSDGDEGQTWMNTAFNDLRKCVKDKAHAHRVYSQTLINQSSAIQQSLDSHKDLMEKTKQAPPTLDPPFSGDRKGTSGSGSSVGCSASMSFVQATCVFEGVRKPRLKLISELDYLSAQMKSIDQQLEDVERLLSSLKESEDGRQVQWRCQLKLEEARTKQDFLSSRRAQLKGELRAVGSELKNFHLRHRDKMVIVVNVFRQHRLRCDSTLRKSFSLLRAASEGDPEVLKTLDAHKESWLSPEAEPNATTLPETDRPISFGAKASSSTDIQSHQTRSSSGRHDSGDVIKSVGSSSGSTGVLKRHATQDRNPLKARKVCFGGTHYSDSDLPQSGEVANNDASSNHSTAGDESESDSGHAGGDSPKVKGKDLRKIKTDKEVEKSLQNEIAPYKNTGKDKRGSWLKFYALKDDQITVQTTEKSKEKAKDYELTVEVQLDSTAESKCSPSKRKPQFPSTEETPKQKTESGKHESSLKTDESEDKKIRDDISTGSNFSPNPKYDQSSSNYSFRTKEAKGKSWVLKEKSDNLSAVGGNETMGNENAKYGNPRPGSVSPIRSECRDNKTVTTYHPHSQIQLRPPHKTIVLSTKSRNKQAPVKTLVQGLREKSRSNISDLSHSAAPKKQTGPNADFEESSSLSDSDTSESRSPSGVPSRGGKVEASQYKETKPRQGRVSSGVESSTGSGRSTGNRPSALGSGKPQAPHVRTAAQSHRSGDTSGTSSDTGRRRVAFSDLETNDSQKTDFKFRESPASGSQAGALVHDRGILKKPSDSNKPVKTVILREDKVITSRVKLDHRSHSDNSQVKQVSRSEPAPSITQQAGGGPRVDLEQTTGRSERSLAQGVFIPEVSESSQSRSSSASSASSPEDDDDDEDPSLDEMMKRLEREEQKMKSFMIEQKRMLEEEDRMNLLISKYANNRRGLGGLSKNFNNSEMAMATCDPTRVAEDMTVEGGRTDRLEFDADMRLDKDGVLNSSTSVGPEPRQLKVCTVRPIATDPTDLCRHGILELKTEIPGTLSGQLDTAGDRQNFSKLDSAQVARLKEYEVTAGQFVVRKGSGEAEVSTNQTMRVEQQTTSMDVRGPAAQPERQSAARNRCGWSAQKYSDCHTDLNNNLSSVSSVCESVTVGMNEQQFSVSRRSDTPCDVPRGKPSFQRPICDRNTVPASSDSAQTLDCVSLPARHSIVAQHQYKIYTDHVCSNLSTTTGFGHQNRATSSGCFTKNSYQYTNATNPVGSNLSTSTALMNLNRTNPLDRSRFTKNSHSCPGSSEHQECSNRLTAYQKRTRPWLYDTGYECYSTEEKKVLPDPKLLCPDNTNDTLSGGIRRNETPLKSCLKRRACGGCGDPQETTTFIGTKCNNSSFGAMVPLEGNEHSTCRPYVSEKSISTETYRSPFSSHKTWHRVHNDYDCRALQRTPIKYQKRVQFREAIHCTRTPESDWSGARACARLLRWDDQNLNLSNNSNTADGHSACKRHAMGFQLCCSRSLRPFAERIVAYIMSKQRKNRDMLGKKLFNCILHNTLRWSERSAVLSGTGRNNHPHVSFCMFESRKKASLFILISHEEDGCASARLALTTFE